MSGRMRVLLAAIIVTALPATSSASLPDTSIRGHARDLAQIPAAAGAVLVQQRQYITGPRDGCYYINRNGNRTYVDRSYCRR